MGLINIFNNIRKSNLKKNYYKMSKLVGTWNLVESENFDDYLKVMGVSFMLRKVASTIKPSLTIENSGNDWVFKVTSTFKNQETKFTDGVAFDEATMDGRESTNTIRSEGSDKLVQEQTVGGLKNHIVREVVDDRLVMTMNSQGVSCKRIYKRV